MLDGHRGQWVKRRPQGWGYDCKAATVAAAIGLGISACAGASNLGVEGASCQKSSDCGAGLQCVELTCKNIEDAANTGVPADSDDPTSSSTAASESLTSASAGDVSGGEGQQSTSSNPGDDASDDGASHSGAETTGADTEIEPDSSADDSGATGDDDWGDDDDDATGSGSEGWDEDTDDESTGDTDSFDCELTPPLDCDPRPGPIEVEGTLFEDTTWCAHNSPVRVVKDTAVSEGTTLTIGPGTRIEVEEDVRFIVRGNLAVHGQADDRVAFTAAALAPQPGSWRGLSQSQESASLLMCHTDFEYSVYGLSLRGDRAYIEHGRFRHHTETALSGEVGARVWHSKFHDNECGISALEGEVHGSEFWNNTSALCAHDSTIHAHDCSFHDNEFAARIAYGELTGSLIFDNGTAVRTVDAKLRYNTIVDNDVGISLGEGAIHKNNICRNTSYGLTSQIGDQLDATDNWWCTNDASQIDSMIIDAKDDANLKLIDYMPVSDGWIPEAPADPG